MRICEDCGEKVLVKNTWREHWNGSGYVYRCTSCRKVRVQHLIERTRRALGLPATEADQGP